MKHHQRWIYNTKHPQVGRNTRVSHTRSYFFSGFWRGQTRSSVFLQVSFSRAKMCCCHWEYCYHLQNADETTTPLELGTADEMSGRCRPADIREQRNIKHLWTPSDDRLRIEISGESLQLFYRHSASSLRKHLRNRKAKAVPTASSLDGDPKGTMHTFGTLIHFAQKVRGSEKWLEFPEIHSSTLHESS